MKEQIFSALLYLKARLQEPSSLVAIAFLADKFHVSAGDIANILGVVTTCLGFGGFFIAEKKPITVVLDN